MITALRETVRKNFKNDIFTNDENVFKFIIRNEHLIRIIEALAQKYDGLIPESEIEYLGLTPTHVQITFVGKYEILRNQ